MTAAFKDVPIGGVFTAIVTDTFFCECTWQKTEEHSADLIAISDRCDTVQNGPSMLHEHFKHRFPSETYRIDTLLVRYDPLENALLMEVAP